MVYRRSSRALYDYLPHLDWLRDAGLSEDELRQIRVHDSPPPTSVPFLSLGYIPPGAPPADQSFVRPIGTRQLYAWQSDVPPHLWQRLETILHRPVGPSGRPQTSLFGAAPIGITDEEDPLQTRDELWPAPPEPAGD